MQDTVPFLSNPNPNTNPFTLTHSTSKPHFPSPYQSDFPSLSRSKIPPFPTLSSKTITTLLPPITSKIPTISPPPHPTSSSDFTHKMLYLDSLGLDSFSLITKHPPIIWAPLPDLKSTVDYLTSMTFTARELHRIVSMCPEVISTRLSALISIFTFLLREASVNGSDLKRVVNRRPRLLACSVKDQLRPTLYFLRSIGISENETPFLVSSLMTDPSGNYGGWKAAEMVADNQAAQSMRKQYNKDDITRDAVVQLALNEVGKTMASTSLTSVKLEPADVFLKPSGN